MSYNSRVVLKYGKEKKAVEQKMLYFYAATTLAQGAEVVCVMHDGRSYSAAPQTSVSLCLNSPPAFYNYTKEVSNQYGICCGLAVA